MKIMRYPQNIFNHYMSEQSIDDSNVSNKNAFFICLNSTAWIHSKPYFKEEHDNVINLYFDDVHQSGPKEIKWFNNTTKIIDAVAMNNEQAICLAKFIDKIPTNSTVYIYCAKGKSRSGAVEDYIKSIIQEDYTPLEGSNKYVYDKLHWARSRL